MLRSAKNIFWLWILVIGAVYFAQFRHDAEIAFRSVSKHFF